MRVRAPAPESVFNEDIIFSQYAVRSRTSCDQLRCVHDLLCPPLNLRSAEPQAAADQNPGQPRRRPSLLRRPECQCCEAKEHPDNHRVILEYLRHIHALHHALFVNRRVCPATLWPTPVASSTTKSPEIFFVVVYNSSPTIYGLFRSGTARRGSLPPAPGFSTAAGHRGCWALEPHGSAGSTLHRGFRRYGFLFPVQNGRTGRCLNLIIF